VSHTLENWSAAAGLAGWTACTVVPAVARAVGSGVDVAESSESGRRKPITTTSAISTISAATPDPATPHSGSRRRIAGRGGVGRERARMVTWRLIGAGGITPCRRSSAHNWLLEPLGCGMANPMRRPCTDTDSVIDAADAEPNPAARWKMYLDIELCFFGPDGEHPIIPLALRVNYTLAQPWVSGPLDTDGISGGRHYDWITVDVQARPGGS